MSEKWETFTRQTPLELTGDGDGRTLIGRVVPYNVIATVADPPTYKPYRESFATGAFRAQVAAANRVLLNFNHRQGISDVVGRGISLDDRPDGLYGAFRVLDHPDGDKALQLYHDRVLTGMSTEFAARKSRTVDGVVERVDARILGVALCREHGVDNGAAYQGAEVLAVRTEGDEPPPDEPEPEPEPEPVLADTANPDLMARLEALGVTPILMRAVTRKPWDGSPTRFTDEEYQASCLIDRGGDAPVKERCSLPVLEPNGDLNTNALGAAAARLNQVVAPSAMKAQAARKLIRYYRMAQMTPPPRVTMMAGM